MQELDLPDERDDREPVTEQGEQEERPEERQEPNNSWAAGLAHEIDEPLHDELEQALKTAGLFAQARRRQYPDEDEHGHHDPRGEDGVRDRDVVPYRDRSPRRDVVCAR